jgi:hypothetical protein
MISLRGVSDVFTTLDAMMSRISDDMVVVFTPLVLRLSIPTRRDTERRCRVRREKRCLQLQDHDIGSHTSLLKMTNSRLLVYIR